LGHKTLNDRYYVNFIQAHKEYEIAERETDAIKMESTRCVGGFVGIEGRSIVKEGIVRKMSEMTAY
jgi:hypothetical protein